MSGKYKEGEVVLVKLEGSGDAEFLPTVVNLVISRSSQLSMMALPSSTASHSSKMMGSNLMKSFLMNQP